jgi:hypothetical protein
LSLFPKVFSVSLPTEIDRALDWWITLPSKSPVGRECEKSDRELAIGERGYNWDTMTEEEKEAFIDEIVHEPQYNERNYPGVYFTMNITLSPELEQLINSRLATEKYNSVEDLLKDALINLGENSDRQALSQKIKELFDKVTIQVMGLTWCQLCA